MAKKKDAAPAEAEPATANAYTTMTKADVARRLSAELNTKSPAAIIKAAAEHGVTLAAGNVSAALKDKNPAAGASKAKSNSGGGGINADDLMKLHELAAKVDIDDLTELAAIMDRAGGVEEVEKMLTVIQKISGGK